MILIFYSRNTGELIKIFINPKSQEEYYADIARESRLLKGFELLDVSRFWPHVTK
jgi:hypothetical protein